MRMITCAACHADFYTTRSDADAVACFEAEHHVDHGSVPTVAVCQGCAEAIKEWWRESTRATAVRQVGGTLH